MYILICQGSVECCIRLFIPPYISNRLLYIDNIVLLFIESFLFK